MVFVELRDGEDLETALRRFKNKCIKEKIFVELRRKRFYEKPSEVRRRERLKALRKLARKLRKQQKLY